MQPPKCAKACSWAASRAAEALVLVALGPGAARVAQRHDEDVHLGGLGGETRAHLAPVDLRLLARLGLEAPLRERRRGGLGTQRAHRVPHRVVAALVAAARAQLLEQDLRREVHLRGALGEPPHVRREQRLDQRRAPIRRPLGLTQTATHGLAIEPRRARDLRHRLPFRAHPTDLLPTFLTDHRLLRAHLGHGYVSRRADAVGPRADRVGQYHLPIHLRSPCRQRVGKIQFPQMGIIGFLMTVEPQRRQIGL